MLIRNLLEQIGRDPVGVTALRIADEAEAALRVIPDSEELANADSPAPAGGHRVEDTVVYDPAFRRAVERFAEGEWPPPNLRFASQMATLAWCIAEVETRRRRDDGGESCDVCC